MQRQAQEASLQMKRSAAMLPLGEAFDHKVRPLLDAVDKLRSMGAVEEGISLPTIVVVGDQSSGKSSVVESLSRVELPKGQGIVTRVPLILKLKGSPLTKIMLSFRNETTGEQFEKEIAEHEIISVLTSATDALAGSGKDIAETPITLHVSKPGAPDLTLVDLPGITRVPVQDQPSNIYEKIHALIRSYIEPEGSLILNVLSAAMDFSVCESVRMSKEVDKLGKRTLAVVTKVDMCPDGLVEKIKGDVVNIGLGYICMRNRTEKEGSFKEALQAEQSLFSTHAELKLLSESTVGVEALANRLMQLQARSISGALPRLLKQIDHAMDKRWSGLKQMGCEDASVAFLNVSFSVRKSLEMILAGGATEATSKNEAPYHYLACLQQEFEKFASMLTFKLTTPYSGSSRQIDWGQLGHIKGLPSEYQSTNLPGTVPVQSIIQKILSQTINSIADACTLDLPFFVHEEARKVASSVISKHVGQFPYLKKLYTTAFQRALNQCKSKCSHTIARLLEMEEAVIYTSDSALYNSLVGDFRDARSQSRYGGEHYVRIHGWVVRLWMPEPRDKTGSLIEVEAEKEAAYGVLAYWVSLSRRLAEYIPRELRFSFNEALLSAKDEVECQVVGSGLSMEEVMAEQPEAENKRQRVTAMLDVLQQSKDLISQVLDDACFA